MSHRPNQALPAAALMVSALLAAALVVPASPVMAVTPTIIRPAQVDADDDGIADGLEAEVAEAVAAGDAARAMRVIVTLYSRPGEGEAAVFRDHGGVVRHRYTHGTYGLAGTLPAGRIADLPRAFGANLCIVERDVPGSATLDDSARQIRVRPLVWKTSNGYGLDGDPSTVIAVFDSGIDTTHTDLSGGRLSFWHDFTSEGRTSSTDQNGHGSHVSGIAAGTGAAIGSGSVGTLTTTMSGRLPSTNGWGYADMIKVPAVGTGQITSNLSWQGSGTGQINLATSGATWLGGYTSSSPPLTHTWSISSTDVYKARAGNSSGLGGRPYSMLVTYPYQAVGDGFNLFRGVAPACKLAGAKILDQTGSGWASDWTAAFDSLAAVNTVYNIKVANASVALDGGATNTALRTAVNSLVSAGTVVVISAGNDYNTFKVADPGLAQKAITVGAINDFGAMTGYSSNGPSASNKPDVVAPGGSHSWYSNVGSEITSIDTNVNDAYATTFADRQANDYANMHGTSMAAPHVAGLAALVIDAYDTYGYGWGFSEWSALNVKMIIQMTATETNKQGEESSGNNPPLNRGGKDRVEGYGRINADAAVEAIKNWIDLPPETTLTVTFGSGPFDRKCWASQVGICGPDPVTIKLDVPSGADFDLYLYSPDYTGDGEPVIDYSSTTAATAADESVTVDLDYVCEAYYLVVKRVSGQGTATITGRVGTLTAVGDTPVPSAVSLGRAYPNPFGTSTTIPYGVPGPGTRPVTLRVYDVRGALVKTLVSREVPGGVYRAGWDGTDERGRRVASGVYFARLAAGRVTRVTRLIVVR